VPQAVPPGSLRHAVQLLKCKGSKGRVVVGVMVVVVMTAAAAAAATFIHNFLAQHCNKCT
jgi:uncharacterized membrane protein